MERAGLLGTLLVVAAASGALGACRDDAASPARPAAGPIDLTAPAAGPDDVIVARVDGRPVWGSCVAAQAAGRRLARATALAECVDLELLAGAAGARGRAADPEVAEAGREASVTRLVDREFRQRFQRFDDLPAAVGEPVLARNLDRMIRPESRASYLVRIEVDPAAAGGPADLAAGAAMQVAYAELAARRDLFPPDVLAAVEAAAGTPPPGRVFGGVADPTTADFGLQTYYRTALFAVPDIGQLTPPQRSPYGWDLILYTDFRRPAPMTRDQLAAKLFEPLRQRHFLSWSLELGKSHQVTLLADEAALRRLWGPPTGPGRTGPP